MVVLLSIVFALTGCLPKTAGQEPPVPVVSIKAYLPEDTPDDATIYIIGNYCNWDNFGEAKTSDVKTDDEGKKYAEFELEISQFPLEYKYTVGPDWAYVEVKADGSDLDGNRKIDSAPDGVVEDTVQKWKDIPAPALVKLKAFLPENTPEDGTVYIVGNYCGWESGWETGNAATSTVKTDEGNKYAEFELEISHFPLEYKYTVGPDWAYVEVKADGTDLIGNRVIDSAREGVIEDTVQKWKDIPESQEPTEPPTVGVITLDGDFSDWESYEEAKKTIVDDPDDDSKWEAENDVNWLGIAADEGYLYIGAQYKASRNGFIVYISIDGDETGATNMNFGGWPRAITFDKNVQYFVASWEHGYPELWQVEDTETKTKKDNPNWEIYKEQIEGYEIKIPLSELGLESGDKIHFVGCIVGGDGSEEGNSSSPDTAPDNDYPENWDWNVDLNITNMAEFVIP